jgi:hypothetical protein
MPEQKNPTEHEPEPPTRINEQKKSDREANRPRPVTPDDARKDELNEDRFQGTDN